LAEGVGTELAPGEITRRPRHAAQPVGLHVAGRIALAEDHFGRTPADVHHQPALVGLRQQARNPLVDQAGFFLAGDDLDAEAQDGLGLLQEFLPVARLAQGLGRHRAHLLLAKALQALGEAGQAVPAALHRRRAEHLVFVEAVALAHGFLEVLDAFDVARLEAPDFEAEAVGAKVDGGEQGTVLHGAKAGTGAPIVTHGPGAAA
jgi:hypothetical protein